MNNLNQINIGYTFYYFKSFFYLTPFLKEGGKSKITRLITIYIKIPTEPFNVEEIRLQRYQALKTMISLFCLAVSFIYTKLDMIIISMLFETKTVGYYKKKLSEIKDFIYYKLTYAVRAFFVKIVLRIKTLFNQRSAAAEKKITFQLELKFEGI